MQVHARAPLSPIGRRRVVERVGSRTWSVAAAAEAAGVSERTIYRWLARFRDHGEQGLIDRPSIARQQPRKTPPERVEVICALRRLRMTAAEIAEICSMPLSTVSAILAREGLGKRSRLTPLEPANRYERRAPGELVHIDITTTPPTFHDPRVDAPAVGRQRALRPRGAAGHVGQLQLLRRGRVESAPASEPAPPIRRGSAAPAENDRADVHAACNGRQPLLVEAKLVTGVRLERAAPRQRTRHLARQRRRQAPTLIDPGELEQLAVRVAAKLGLLQPDVGLLGVAPRADRHALAGGHRQRPGHRPGDPGRHDRGARRARRAGRSHAEHEARGRHDAVVGAQHGGPQPVGAVAEMDLRADRRRAHASEATAGTGTAPRPAGRGQSAGNPRSSG
jgi:transposase